MTPQDSYNKIKKMAAVISDQQWRRPMGTASQIIKDGYDQIAVATEDQVELVEAGMPETLIQSTNEFLNGYSWVDGLYATTLCSDKTLRQEWESGIDNGFTLRGKLFKFGSFGIRRNKRDDLQPLFAEILKGIGPDNMIMDLKELHQFYSSNPTVTIGLKQFNICWINESLELHNTLTELRTKLRATADQTNLDQFYTEKRGAFTLYQNSIDEIREWGAFVFEGTDRALKYRAGFLVGRGGKPTHKKVAKTETEVVAPQM